MFRRILSAALIAVSLTGVAFATPGAVDKHGCHSHPRHCHSWSDISYMKNGRPYVAFGNGDHTFPTAQVKR